MRKWLVILAAAALLAFPAAGFAGVQGSLHDVDAYKGVDQKAGGACAFCHIPHGAGGEKLYKDATTINAGSRWEEASQPVSRICITCHNASGAGIIVSANRTVAITNDNAHGPVVATVQNWGDEINLAGKPNMKLSTDSAKLECTSCHDPHQTTYRPFLKFVSTAGDIHANCVNCHGSRTNGGISSVGGINNHRAWASPTNTGWASQHPTNRNMTGDNPGDQAEEWQGTIDTAFTTAPVTDNSQAALSSGNYWSSKGKYGLNSTVGCQTCHAVHGVESGSNGETGTVSFYNGTDDRLALLAKERTFPVGGSAFCQGCHTANVVTAAGQKHPVNRTETNWTATVDVANLTYTWTWPTQSAKYQLVCETCHDVHYGSDNTAILRKQASNSGIDNQMAGNFANVGNFCAVCHATSPGKGPAFATGNHHPVSYQKDGTTVLALDFDPAGGSNISRDGSGTTINHSTIDWSNRTRTQNSTPYTWGTIDTSTVMSCGSCHGNSGSGAAAAHTLAFPVDTNTESELCVDCHTFNPSTFVLDYQKGTATLHDNSLMTHYVGGISTAARAQAPPAGWKRQTAFTGTSPAVAPKYSTDGANGSIICESCHYWKDGNVSATNLGANGHDSTLVQDNVYGMLAIAGNNTESTAADAYMCSGCHGAAPGGGSSHPTRPAGYTSNATQLSDVTGILGTQPDITQAKATLNSSNRVNCDSCHRPHNAAIGTGALILESSDTNPMSNKPAFQLSTDNTGGTQLNQEGTCQRCHPQGR